MEKNLSDGADHKDVKLSYTIFPKDATAKEIYEHLMKWSEEAEKAPDDVSSETAQGSET